MTDEIDRVIIEHKLRTLPVDKLKALKMFCTHKELSSTALSNATGSAERSLGGKVSSLKRTFIEGLPLVQQKGSENRRAILSLNEKVVSQTNLKSILKEIGI